MQSFLARADVAPSLLTPRPVSVEARQAAHAGATPSLTSPRAGQPAAVARPEGHAARTGAGASEATAAVPSGEAPANDKAAASEHVASDKVDAAAAAAASGPADNARAGTDTAEAPPAKRRRGDDKGGP